MTTTYAADLVMDYDDAVGRFDPALGLEVHEIGRAHV